MPKPTVTTFKFKDYCLILLRDFNRYFMRTVLDINLTKAIYKKRPKRLRKLWFIKSFLSIRHFKTFLYISESFFSY